MEWLLVWLACFIISTIIARSMKKPTFFRPFGAVVVVMLFLWRPDLWKMAVGLAFIFWLVDKVGEYFPD